MNTAETRFDRLVDDELDEQERRELLAGLDDEPGGWRHCALAFLESQCWKKTFRAMRPEEAPKSSRPAPYADMLPAPEADRLPSKKSRSQWRNHLGTLLAMAACFLVAFYVGSLFHKTNGDRSATSAGIRGEVATTVGENQAPTQPVPDRSLAGADSPRRETSKKPWQMVTVAAPAGSPLQLPAVERANIDPQWLQNLPPAVPEDVMQTLNRTGHQVDQQRELVPVQLQDGRQFVVPIDNVNVRYVGDGPY